MEMSAAQSIVSKLGQLLVEELREIRGVDHLCHGDDQWDPVAGPRQLGGGRARQEVRFIRVVSGVRYNFVIDAFDASGRPAKYDAVLAGTVWQNRRVFISFNPAR
ncbi:hypothetical protein HU200_022625 [Digitaria exilis]|uniref:Cystatin n=1 Tax=Digitaria exilis TaxID=1010633 RepID=A0A835EY06_9POAL|nr:hypothetical protein HU200_022625 [Digitaria exilis]